ncbi:hypothetical protein [Bifidobacterium breve]|uniref:hypothetical protein n=1 Tax=Bifidobacterium breve TaxID=1685 RepID=UPI000AD9E630|nr:hypothetical protein [Bifidobacterium breve]MDU1781448.1 hypothetical protein [Bifidobacterium breve]
MVQASRYWSSVIANRLSTSTPWILYAREAQRRQRSLYGRLAAGASLYWERHTLMSKTPSGTAMATASARDD